MRRPLLSATSWRRFHSPAVSALAYALVYRLQQLYNTLQSEYRARKILHRACQILHRHLFLGLTAALYCSVCGTSSGDLSAAPSTKQTMPTSKHKRRQVDSSSKGVSMSSARRKRRRCRHRSARTTWRHVMPPSSSRTLLCYVAAVFCRSVRGARRVLVSMCSCRVLRHKLSARSAVEY